jgi:hypothetical protein
VFRDGPEHYTLWREFRSLPVISVAPVRRPKLDETGTRYSFEQEKELMMEKMRTVLRIAAYCGNRDICLGAFGARYFETQSARLPRCGGRFYFTRKSSEALLLTWFSQLRAVPPATPKGASQTSKFSSKNSTHPISSTPRMCRTLLVPLHRIVDCVSGCTIRDG